MYELREGRGIAMTEPGVEPTFIKRTKWHIVEAGPLSGSVVGSFYVFKCFRWAAEKDAQGLARGRPTDRAGTCGGCATAARRPSGDGLRGVPLSDVDPN